MASTLVDTYRRYKAGTEKLLKWLTESAHQSSTEAVSKVTVTQLLDLAKRVTVAQTPKIAVPIEIVDVAKDTIQGRQDCAEWYATLAKGEAEDSATAQSNVRHAHFLKNLRQIYELLRGAHKASLPKRKKKLPELASDQHDLTNLYAHLELEEPAAALGDNSATSAKLSSTARKTAKSTPKYQLDNEDEEKNFAIWCFFKDVFDVRMYVRDIWQQYKAGDLSFLNTIKISDAAVHMLQEAGGALARAHPDLQYFDNLMDHLGAGSFMIEARYRSSSDWSRTVEYGEQAATPMMERRSDLLCMPAWCALNDLATILRGIQNQDHDDYKGKKPHVAMLGHPFASVLFEIAWDLDAMFPLRTDAKGQMQTPKSVYDPSGTAGAYMDHYSLSLLKFVIAPFVDLGLGAATQLYMDIYDVMDGELQCGVVEVTSILDVMQSSALRFENFIKTSDSYVQAHIPDSCIRGMLSLSKDVQHSQVRNGTEGWVFHLPGQSKTSFIPLNILTTLPLLAGFHVWRLNCQLQSYGMALCDRNYTALAAAHLYNAARTLGMLDVNWVDMDFVTSGANQGGAFLRTSDAPTPRSIARQYALSLGVPFQRLARCDKPAIPKPGATSNQCAKLDRTSSLEIADRNISKASSAGKEQGLRAYYECVKLHAATGAGIQDTVISAQWVATKRLAPVQLLRVVQESLAADEPYINFDYTAFLTKCLTVLEQVVEAYHLQQTAKSGCINSSLKLCMYEVVDEVLWKAAFADDAGLGLSETLLQRASSSFQNLIHESGDDGMRRCDQISRCGTTAMQKLEASCRLFIVPTPPTLNFTTWDGKDPTGKKTLRLGKDAVDVLAPQAEALLVETMQSGVPLDEALSHVSDWMRPKIRQMGLEKQANMSEREREEHYHYDPDEIDEWVESGAFEKEAVEVMKLGIWWLTDEQANGVF